MVGAGILVGAGMGETVAISGVALFFGTAALAGAERTEIATALGGSGVVWSSTGISVVLGTDPSLVGSLVGLCVAGGAAVTIGILGAMRARARPTDLLRPDPSP